MFRIGAVLFSVICVDKDILLRLQRHIVALANATVFNVFFILLPFPMQYSSHLFSIQNGQLYFNMYNRFFYVEILGIYRNFTNFAMNIKNEEVLYHIVHVDLSVFRKYLRKG